MPLIQTRLLVLLVRLRLFVDFESKEELLDGKVELSHICYLLVLEREEKLGFVTCWTQHIRLTVLA